MEDCEGEKRTAIVAVSVNNGDDLVDVTSIFEKAAEALTFKNPLLCEIDSFSLQESMAALELMEPTMDCCEIDASAYSQFEKRLKDEKKIIVPPRPANTSINDKNGNSLPWDDLTLHQALIVIMKQICCLDSMISGSSVIESTFTCLYAHDSVLNDMREQLTNDTVKPPFDESSTAPKWAIYASTLILVKLCETIRKIILHADIYEEEDFTPNAATLKFFSVVGEKEVLDTLSFVINMFATMAKDNQSRGDAAVISLALDFQLQMLVACLNLAKLTMENVRQSVESTKKTVNVSMKKIDQLIQIISCDHKEIMKNNEKFMSVIFDPFVNRRLLGSTPVRKIKFKEPIEAIQNLKVIFRELDWAVCDLFLKGNTLGRIKRMLSYVSKCSVNILSRSIIILNMYFDELLLGQYQLGILIAEHMQQIGGVPQTLLVSESCLNFLHRLGKPTYETLKVFVANRNRQAAYIETLMIKEWAFLQKEASAIDYFFREEHKLDSQTTPFTTNYVISITNSILEHYLGVSIELDLYTGHYDLSIAFWYWDFLISTQLNVSNMMILAKQERLKKQQTIHMQEEQQNAPIRSKRDKKKGKRGDKGKRGGNKGGTTAISKPPEITAEDLEDHISSLVLSLKRNLCRGTVRFFAALTQGGICKKPKYEFTTHEKRFEKRFQIFEKVGHPPALKYDDFIQGSDFSTVSQLDLISSARECFKSAKATIDNLLDKINKVDELYLAMRKEEIMKLAKVCIGNQLYLHKLLMQVQNGGDISGSVMKIDFNTHDQFCSITLT